MNTFHVLKNAARYLLPAAILLILPAAASAQMFTVDRDKPKRSGPANRIYIGLEPTQFAYFGPEDTPLGRARFDMNYPLLRIRYEMPHSSFFLGYGDAFMGADSVDIFNFGGTLSRPIPVHNAKKFRFFAPIRLQAALTTASNDRISGEQFQQSVIMLGIGPGVGLNITPKLRSSMHLIPSLGYSISPGGTFGGMVYKLGGSFRFYVDEIYDQYGLSVGYDYTFKRFDVSVDRFDYKLRSHSVLIGITF